MTGAISTISALCLACISAEAGAAVITADFGDPCKITSIGSFTCEWINSDGGITSVSGIADLAQPYPDNPYKAELRGTVSFLVDTVFPRWGSIEIELPYTNMMPTRLSNTTQMLNVSLGGYDIRGATTFTSQFTGHARGQQTLFSLLGPQGPVEGPYARAFAANYGADRFLPAQASGLWLASISWSNSNDGLILPGSRYVDFYTNRVPEPATWAMMIAGFGLVGAAARRRQAPGCLRSGNQPA